MNSELQAIEEQERQYERYQQARDMFAAAALQGAMTGARGLGELSPEDLRETLDMVAELCWKVADAMMRNREAAK